MTSILTKIQSLSQLLQELAEARDTEFPFIASRLEINVEELKKHAVFSKDKYTRVCLFRNEQYELLLLGWEAGQSTPIHGHGQQECWVHFVEGEFVETLFAFEPSNNVLKRLKTIKANNGATSYMEDSLGYHSLQNVSEMRAISLHLYVKPIDECMVYNEEIGEFSLMQMAYDQKLPT